MTNLQVQLKRIIEITGFIQIYYGPVNKANISNMLIHLKSSKWTLDRFKDNGGIFFFLVNYIASCK